MNCLAVAMWTTLALAGAGRTGQAGPATKPATPAQVTTVEGERFSGRLVELDDRQAVFRTGKATRRLALEDVWFIRWGQHGRLLERAGQKAILLAGEGMVGIRELALRGGGIRFDSELLGEGLLELPAAAAVYLPARDQRPAALRQRCRQLELPPAAHDYLIAEDEGRLVPFPGALKAIGPEKVAFELRGVEKTIERAAVRAIVLARMPSQAKAPLGRLLGKDGSAVPFGSARFSGSKLSIAGAGLAAEAVNLSAAAEIRFRSDRLVHLSDMKPAKVARFGMFDVAFPLGYDRSAAGGPIRLGGVGYSRGLGLHSRCELTYELGGEFALFAAVAGIDEAGGDRGNATLSILGDGKELLQPLKLAGGGKPVPIRCSVAGVERLTILADYGPDGVDVGDHVDLAEARLIKPRPTTRP